MMIMKHTGPAESGGEYIPVTLRNEGSQSDVGCNNNILRFFTSFRSIQNDRIKDRKIKTKLIPILIFLSSIFNSLPGVIINVPVEYPNIQRGIIAAVDGDTVLIAPGTYFENIEFLGKSITVTSSAGMYETIIDGNMNGCVVKIDSDETGAELSGFTIQNGKGGAIYDYWGDFPIETWAGGVTCEYNSNPTLKNLKVEFNGYVGVIISSSEAVVQNCEIHNTYITEEDGGGRGIYVSSSEINIENCNIHDNESGGISLYATTGILRNCLIHHNTVDGSGGGVSIGGSSSINIIDGEIYNNTAETYGGGIRIYEPYIENLPTNSHLTLSGVSIHDNHAGSSVINIGLGFGGGIYIEKGNVEFDSQNRSSIFNNSARAGSDIMLYQSLSSTVYLDTFSVAAPTGWYARPVNNLEFDINTGLIEQTPSDLYLSPWGSDENSGTSPGSPLKTLVTAFSRIAADTSSLRTIFLADGVYSPETTGENFPVCPISNVSIVGESQPGTIIDAGADFDGFDTFLTGGGLFLFYTKNLTLANFTIRNAAAFYGGGIDLWHDSTPLIKNLTMIRCAAYYGGGFGASRSDFQMENVVITQCIAGKGAGMWLSNSNPILDHLTISYNNASVNGSGMYIRWESHPVINNSIIYYNTSNEIYFEDWSNHTSAITISYTDLQNGESEIISNNGSINWLEGNIDSNPYFVSWNSNNFNLQPYSPCIDAGDPNSPLDPDGTITDMGAYYFDQGGLLGDLNSDGYIDILDIVRIISIILGDEPSDWETYAADVNQDGAINILDVVALVNLILGA